MILTEKEVRVLKLKNQEFTQLVIAKKLKITQPAVSNFYRKALQKIKEAEEVMKLKRELRLK